VQLTTGCGEGLGEASVQRIAAEPERGGWETLLTDELFAVKPSDLPVLQGVREQGLEAEAFDGDGREPGHEISADSVSRIISGFDHAHGDPNILESETKREAS
jgi:hypothetical protein